MRSKYSLLIFAGFAGILIPACAPKDQGRWVKSEELLSFTSIEQITNKFATYEYVASHGFDLQDVRTRTSRFLFVTTHPYSGSSVFNAFCFEQLNPSLWRLRSELLFHQSNSMQLRFVPEGDVVNVLQDGQVVFKIVSLSALGLKGREVSPL
jgi:hypothetical protein